jgi:hypothetical protein
MKRRLSEAVVQQIMSQLLERFGEPIGDAQGDGQGVPSSHKKEDMGNRGFGAKLQMTGCNECGGMMDVEGATCTNCGEMPHHMEPKGPHIEPDGSIDMGGGHEEHHAEPDGDEVIVVVGRNSSPSGQPTGRFAAGVAKPKDMDIPPEALPKKGKPAGPSAPPSRPVKA